MEQEHPDVMIGNESWLNPNIYSSSFWMQYFKKRYYNLMVMEECLLLATITDFDSINTWWE